MKNHTNTDQSKELRILRNCLDNDDCEEFVKQYHKLIIKTIQRIHEKCRVTLTSDDLDDMVGEVFVQIFDNDCKKLRLYDENKGAKLSVWIYFIVQSTVYNCLRKRRINYILYSDMNNEIKEYLKNKAFETELTIEQHVDLEKAMKSLNSKDIVIMKLAYYQGLSSKEIGKILDMEARSINNRKVNIIKQLISFIN